MSSAKSSLRAGSFANRNGQRVSAATMSRAFALRHAAILRTYCYWALSSIHELLALRVDLYDAPWHAPMSIDGLPLKKPHALLHCIPAKLCPLALGGAPRERVQVEHSAHATPLGL